MFSQVNEKHLRVPEINLCTMLIDDSGSLQGSELVMVNAINSAVSELMAADGQRDKYWLGVTGFNGKSFHREMSPISPKHQIGADEYYADNGTPLYRRTFELLRYQQAERARLTALGIKVRTATIILTDGVDSYANDYRGTEILDKLQPLALDMAQSPHHMLIGIGIMSKEVIGKFPSHVRQQFSFGNAGNFLRQILSAPRPSSETGPKLHETPYHYVFEELMGFAGPSATIIAAENSASAVANAMRQASQSIARVGAGAREVATGF